MEGTGSSGWGALDEFGAKTGFYTKRELLKLNSEIYGGADACATGSAREIKGFSRRALRGGQDLPFCPPPVLLARAFDESIKGSFAPRQGCTLPLNDACEGTFVLTLRNDALVPMVPAPVAEEYFPVPPLIT